MAGRSEQANGRAAGPPSVASDQPAVAALATACALIRATYGAAAVSVAVAEDDHLHYIAADGAGANAIVGQRLPAGRGIAGFVAATGQSLTVRDPRTDPRFAREVGESTGYVPETIQCVPVDDGGDVLAVLSILDRGSGPAADNTDGPVPLERVTALVAALLERLDDDGDDTFDPHALAALDGRARSAITAIIDALER
jgi:signal transduction protein with GAF and PtsI domain